MLCYYFFCIPDACALVAYWVHALHWDNTVAEELFIVSHYYYYYYYYYSITVCTASFHLQQAIILCSFTR